MWTGSEYVQYSAQYPFSYLNPNTNILENILQWSRKRPAIPFFVNIKDLRTHTYKETQNQHTVFLFVFERSILLANA